MINLVRSLPFSWHFQTFSLEWPDDITFSDFESNNNNNKEKLNFFLQQHKMQPLEQIMSKQKLIIHRTASVGYEATEPKPFIKKNTRVSMTGYERWSTGNCARNENLAILTVIWLNQNQSEKMRFTKFSRTLRYKQITKTWPDNQSSC